MEWLEFITQDFQSLVFYFFAGLMIASAIAVITSNNPVYSVFFLIFAFFNAAGLFVLLGAEYIAMTLVIVYVGAVAVLFLFVVMMLNVNFQKMRSKLQFYLPLGITAALIMFIELGALIYASAESKNPQAVISAAIPDAEKITNTHAIGRILYTDYIYLFQLAGIILLVAMIGAIVLTLRERPGVKRQRIEQQLARKRSDSVVMVDVKPGQGAL